LPEERAREQQGDPSVARGEWKERREAVPEGDGPVTNVGWLEGLQVNTSG